MAKGTTRQLRVPSIRRIAYHEAGHGVLSTAINDSPRLIQILPDGGERLGFARYRFDTHPPYMIQVFLAGYAAEHLHFGRQPRNLTLQIGFAIMAATDEKFSDLGDGRRDADEYLAVQACIQMGIPEEGMRAEIFRFYEIAKESLASVWPAVDAVAKYLMKEKQMDRSQFFFCDQRV
jgi:hypothetical protein